MRRWIGSAQLQIMVCHLFGTKPLSEQTFRYFQELSPGPLVYRNRLQWNFNQNWKLFIHGNASEYIVCEMAAILSRVGWGLTEWELSTLSDRRNAFSILMFGLIFTSFISWNVYTMTLNWISKFNWRNGLVFISSHYISRRKPIFHILLRGHNEFKCFGVIGFMKWWQRRGRVGELVTLRKYIWKIYHLSEVGLKWLIYFAADLAVSSKNLYL